MIYILGCDHKRNNKPDTKPWPADQKHWADTRQYFRDGKQISKEEFGVVICNEGEAISKLENASWVEITSQEAERYLGRPLEGTGGRIVLLRALAITDDTSNFRLSWDEGKVLISHYDRIVGPLPPRIRRAIVARLPTMPSDVFFSLGHAD